MASEDEDEKLPKLAFLQDCLDQRDLEIEILKSRLEESQSNLASVLLDNDALSAALDEAGVERSLYDELVINQSLLNDALIEYEHTIKAANARCENAEAEARETKKQCDNLRVINSLYEQQIKILTREQLKNGICDLLAGHVTSDTKNQIGASASHSLGGGVTSGPQQHAATPVSEPRNSPSASSSSTLSENFVKNTTIHLAITQAAISQFCGAYGLQISGSGEDASQNGPPINSINPDHRNAEVQTVVAACSGPVFCPDCADLKLELDGVKSEQLRLKEKKRKLEKKLDRHQADLEQLDTFKKDVKNQNKKIQQLVKKMYSINGERKKLEAENKSLRKRLNSMVARNEAVEDGELMETGSSRSSTTTESGTSTSSTPVKRKAPEEVPHAQSGQGADRSDLLGVKFKLGAQSKMKRRSDMAQSMSPENSV